MNRVIFARIVWVFVIAFWVLSGSTSTNGADECIVWGKVYKSAKFLNQEDESIKTFEIGRFEIPRVHEGALITKKFRINRAPLNVFIRILYDDNGDYFDDLTDAMSVTLAVSTAPKLTLSSSLSATTSQISRYGDFKFSNLGTVVRYSNRWYDVWVGCRLKREPTKAS